MIEREGKKSIYSVLCIKEKVETYLVHSLKSLYNVTGGSQPSHPHQENIRLLLSSPVSPSGEAQPPPAAERYSLRRGMSRSGKSPKLDLKLNLSLPRRGNTSRMAADNRSSDGSQIGSPLSTSPPSSCVSSEGEQGLRCSNSPEATSMVLAGCPRCLMYVMLSEDDPKCPKCKSTVLLDFLRDNTNNKMNRKS